jgi:hypothetical protein
LTSRKHAGTSERDLETIARVIRRHGLDEYVRLGEMEAERLARSGDAPTKSGPRQLPALPHSIMAALHHCWRLHNDGGTLSKFQKDLRATVEIKYSRTDRNLDRLPDRRKTVKAFREYLRRADWKQPTDSDRRNISLRFYLLMLLGWRFGALEHGAAWKT